MSTYTRERRPTNENEQKVKGRGQCGHLLWVSDRCKWIVTQINITQLMSVQSASHTQPALLSAAVKQQSRHTQGKVSKMRNFVDPRASSLYLMFVLPEVDSAFTDLRLISIRQDRNVVRQTRSFENALVFVLIIRQPKKNVALCFNAKKAVRSSSVGTCSFPLLATSKIIMCR